MSVIIIEAPKTDQTSSALENLSHDVARVKTDLSYSIKNHATVVKAIKGKLDFLENMVRASIDTPDALLDQIKAVSDHLTILNNNLINNLHRHDKKLDKIDDRINASEG